MRSEDLYVHAWTIFASTIRLLGGTTDEATYERLLAVLSDKIDVYGTILNEQKYLAGDVRIQFDRLNAYLTDKCMLIN